MERQDGTRRDVILALSLSALTLLSRWPYRARMLYNWDAVQFALALEEYDIAKHQPHPPGYILHVAVGRLLVRGPLGSRDPAAPRRLEEIALPYGRWLYALPIGRHPVAYAGYTFVKERELCGQGRWTAGPGGAGRPRAVRDPGGEDCRGLRVPPG